MKYSKFIQDVEALGYCAVDTGAHLYITTERGSSRMLLISKTETCNVKSTSDRFNSISARDKEELFNLAVELATTSLKDREDEKKYYLRLPFVADYRSYLNIFRNSLIMGDRHNVNKHKTIFTESEVVELKAKHNLDSFIMEEVSEYES